MPFSLWELLLRELAVGALMLQAPYKWSIQELKNLANASKKKPNNKKPRNLSANQISGVTALS